LLKEKVKSTRSTRVLHKNNHLFTRLTSPGATLWPCSDSSSSETSEPLVTARDLVGGTIAPYSGFGGSAGIPIGFPLPTAPVNYPRNDQTNSYKMQR
jgi:hypothetical protein